MIGGKKNKGKKKANESHPAKNFGSQIPRKQHFLFHLQRTRPEKRESPHSQMDFGGKRGFSFLLSQPEWENFPGIPIPREFWVGNVVAAIPGFFWGEYLGNAGKFQRGGIEEMVPWEEGASGTGTELTGARDLSRLSVLEENSWERQEKGGSVAGFFLGIFSIGKRGRRREKGEKKQSLAPGSLPAIPRFVFGPIPSEFC